MKYPRPEILNTYLNRFSIEFESPKACVPRELQEAEFLDVVGKVKRFPNMKVRRSNDGDFQCELSTDATAENVLKNSTL